jgi:hypothetical protein
MVDHQRFGKFAAVLILPFLLFAGVTAQRVSVRKTDRINPIAVLWEPANVEKRDLYRGPGGAEMQPDLKSVKFLEEDKSGHNKKWKIKDASGRKWVAKFGREAQPETAAVRILYGLGYKTEINYLAPTISIPGKGTFTNVRLEARPDNVERLDEWKWRSNPFAGTDQLQALKIMMVFLTNWDLLDMQNKILRVDQGSRSEHHYIISDLGATFGRMGNNNIPIFYRLGRKTNDPNAWSKAKFIKGVKKGNLVMAYTGGKSRGIMKNITVAQGRWLFNLLSRIQERQWNDAFRAANYSESDIRILTAAAQRRVNELGIAVGGSRFATK